MRLTMCVCRVLRCVRVAMDYVEGFVFLVFIYFPHALQSRVSSCEAILVARHPYTELGQFTALSGFCRYSQRILRTLCNNFINWVNNMHVVSAPSSDCKFYPRDQ